MAGKTRKDVSRYHRWFKLKSKDAMGRQISHRGYGDQFMFAAKTKQGRVAGLRASRCYKDKFTKKKICQERDEKWSYAVPLEMIYLTPLSKWNPYGIEVKSSCNDQINTGDTRNGTGLCKDMSNAKKFACDRFYYLTPNEFYSGNEVGRDPADTAKNGGFCMLDQDKNGVTARATGTRIILPDIPGLGKLRQRFPIALIHGEGKPVWKNLNALTDLVMNNKMYSFMHFDNGATVDPSVMFELPLSRANQVTPHTHFFTLLQSDIKRLMEAGFATVDTDVREKHTHTLKIRYNKKRRQFMYVKCGDRRICIDEHPIFLNEKDDE